MMQKTQLALALATVLGVAFHGVAFSEETTTTEKKAATKETKSTAKKHGKKSTEKSAKTEKTEKTTTKPE
jgi:hypothetical protein